MSYRTLFATIVGIAAVPFLAAQAAAPVAPPASQGIAESAARPVVRLARAKPVSAPLPECPTSAFPSVTADPANGRWAAPRLEVTCNDSQVVVASNGIPPYEFQRTTPSDLREQEYVWRFPRHPELAEEPTAIPLLGPIAIAVNGLPIYGPNEGEHPDPYGDPVYNDILDWCMGHTARRGDYHYHALIVACLTARHDAAQPAPVIAWAFDGFPIYGPMGCVDGACTEVVEYQSGWRQTGDPSTYAWDNNEYSAAAATDFSLDRCNGHVGPLGDYHYHATSGFPYILGCYSGYVDPSALRPERMGGPPPRGGRRGPR
jgi:hypothetical protein